MKSVPVFRLLLAVTAAFPLYTQAANYQVLGWNNLGMHCMDSDYSVFSILPPYNTIEAQLIVGGLLVTNVDGYSITYEAIRDPDGSINSTSIGKGNFSLFDQLLYGPDLPADMGLAGWPMPGPNNFPQPMVFEATNHPAAGVATPVNWFRAEGIPITPLDNAGKKNPYPMMRLIARNVAGTPIATNDIVLPVSDEMDCRTCHASGTQDPAKPSAGWVWTDNPERDYRLNILRLHDERNFTLHPELYTSALAARGFNPQGLYRGVVADGKPVLCAICHASEALGTASYSNTPPLTASMHAHHADVEDPDLHVTLDNSAHRAACYRCHPGSTTRCLRGAMGGAIATDGSLEMQCQSCHGSMSQVGSANRVGWFMEPNCQSCHTGTATTNNGAIRFTSCFTDTNGTPRVAVNQTFATLPNTPAPGLSLYRFSFGHGGLQCSACHGSTHAEFPATHRNDNLRNERIQDHAGVMVECTACHLSLPINLITSVGGPHGMHPVGGAWANEHHDFIGALSDCQACHGTDLRGTPLSRAHTTRTINVNFDGTPVDFPVYRGAEIGCFNCHNGPLQSGPNTSPAPAVANIATNTLNSRPLTFNLPVTGIGADARILSQPAHGSVGVTNNVATYVAEAGFVGTDSFTFAAYDGSKNSLLATGTVAVAQGIFSVTATALVPDSYPAQWPAPFGSIAAVDNAGAAPTFDWNFGDGSAHSSSRYTVHQYEVPGTYFWSLTVSVQSGPTVASTTISGSIHVAPPVKLTLSPIENGLLLGWAPTSGDVLLEQTEALSPNSIWTACTNPVIPGFTCNVTVPNSGTRFYRLRRL